jgi:hypothetical protein
MYNNTKKLPLPFEQYGYIKDWWIPTHNKKDENIEIVKIKPVHNFACVNLNKPGTDNSIN